jgi:hypothetical protein
MEAGIENPIYNVGDLVQSTAVGLRDFEFNSNGRLGILVSVDIFREAAKIWWVGDERPCTVLFTNFKVLSKTKLR